MTLVLWLLVGFFVGALAKALIPKLDRDNYIFALLIAIIGAAGGGFAASIMGLSESLVANVVVSMGGAILFLFFYRQYLSDLANG